MEKVIAALIFIASRVPVVEIEAVDGHELAIRWHTDGVLHEFFYNLEQAEFIWEVTEYHDIQWISLNEFGYSWMEWLFEPYDSESLIA